MRERIREWFSKFRKTKESKNNSKYSTDYEMFFNLQRSFDYFSKRLRKELKDVEPDKAREILISALAQSDREELLKVSDAFQDLHTISNNAIEFCDRAKIIQEAEEVVHKKGVKSGI